MKSLIQKSFIVLILSSFSFSQAKITLPITPIVQNWVFHDDAKQEAAFNFKIEGYIGALARRGTGHSTPALLVIKSTHSKSFKDAEEVQKFVNAKYLKSKGQLLENRELNSALNSLFIYKKNHSGKNYILFVYAFVKGREIVLFTQDSTEEMYQKVLADTYPNVSKAKFVNF